jgi:hypothetical protein
MPKRNFRHFFIKKFYNTTKEIIFSAATLHLKLFVFLKDGIFKTHSLSAFIITHFYANAA